MRLPIRQLLVTKRTLLALPIAVAIAALLHAQATDTYKPVVGQEDHAVGPEDQRNIGNETNHGEAHGRSDQLHGGFDVIYRPRDRQHHTGFELDRVTHRIRTR